MCPVCAVLIHDVKDAQGHSVKRDMITHGIVTGDFAAMKDMAAPDSMFMHTLGQLEACVKNMGRELDKVWPLPDSIEATRDLLQNELDRGPTRETCKQLLSVIQRANRMWPESFVFEEGDPRGVQALASHMVVLGDGIEYGQMDSTAQSRLEQWWCNNQIIFFDNYGEAALVLHRMDPAQGVNLGLPELRWTLQCAREDLLALKYRYINHFEDKMGPECWSRWIEPFNQVLREANSIPSKELEEAQAQERAAAERLRAAQSSKGTGVAAAKEALHQAASRVATLKAYIPIEELKHTTRAGVERGSSPQGKDGNGAGEGDDLSEMMDSAVVDDDLELPPDQFELHRTTSPELAKSRSMI